MATATLVLRSLIYYWRSNLAVVLGVATAVAVLAGALLVGDSVRGSLRDLFVERLGKTDEVVSSTGFFREKLVDEIQADPRFIDNFGGACPLIVFSGVVSDQKTGRRASGVQVYGVDERFWKFHDLDAKVPTLADREVLLSPVLTHELGSHPGETVLLRVEKPTAIPAGSLLGRKDDLGRTIRLVFRETLAPSNLGEFSVRPSQGEVRAIFVSLSRLQKDLEQPRAANLILVKEKNGKNAGAADLRGILNDNCALEDLGVKLRLLDGQRGIALESDRGVISDSVYGAASAAAGESGFRLEPILSYLANGIRVGSREVPYSIVTGLSQGSFEVLRRSEAAVPSGSEADRPANIQTPGNSAAGVADKHLPPIVLDDWAATDLQARPGDSVTLEYYIWEDQGLLSTHSHEFTLAGVVPMKGPAADRDLVPDYPGITTTQNIADWDPPFPVDLQRVRPVDEQYWHQYRTTPKAFIPIDTAQQLWQSRYGKLTSIRIGTGVGSDPASNYASLRQGLRRALVPAENGLSVNAVRENGIEASRGATDFGEYFVYFSFFLVIGALLLASLFFKLGIEQRIREIGTLRAVGFPAATVRGLFIREGALLAVSGSVLGVIGAVGYGSMLMYGLRTWWVGAVGTTALRLHISAASLLIGAIAGMIVALLCIVWTLAKLAGASPRSLLSSSLDAAQQSVTGRRQDTVGASTQESKNEAGGTTRIEPGPAPPIAAELRQIITSLTGHRAACAAALVVAGLVLLLLASMNTIGKTAGFFGAGAILLLALLMGQYSWFRRQIRSEIQGNGWPAVARVGFRNATYRAGRSILCIALIASAAFIIVAVESFKQSGDGRKVDRKSGSGGFPLLAESQLPLYHDPNTPDGREALGLIAQKGFDPERTVFTQFRVRPGDDASCLNLYQPKDPKVIAPNDDFRNSGRFSFQDSLAKTREEKDNPWLLLNRTEQDGAIPVIADANSMTYVLHHKLGDEFSISQAASGPIRLRLVAALEDSIFQGVLLMSEANFLRVFPDRGGYSFFLLDVAPEAAFAAAEALNQQLADFGFQVVPTAERLAAFHRVENTYLTTFEALGGLGLVLGTLGLAAVLLRNVLERRRELALLRAIGYNSGHFALMVIAENAVLVCCGVATGGLCALIAIAPAFASSGGHFPAVSLWMLLVVVVTGLFASLGATVAALRMPLLASLRAE